MNSKEKELSTLWIMYNNGKDSSPTNLNKGFNSKKKTREARKKPIYKSSFEIKDLFIDKVYTNMLIPAIFDAIGNNIIKIAAAIGLIIATIGYLIEKIKG